MDVRINGGGRQDQMGSRNDVSCQTDVQARCDAVHRLQIAGLSDRANAAILDAHVGLHHAQDRVNDRHIGDDEIGGAVRAGHLVIHAHAFAHALAAAEDDFVAVPATQVPLDLHKQSGIAQPDAIAGRRTEETHVLLPRDGSHDVPLK